MMALQAFLSGKCPQCRTGPLFKSSLFSKQFKQIHSHCSHCGVKFESEPGFFWGAMYFSYALAVGVIIVLSVIIYNVYEEPPLLETCSFIIAVSLILIPLQVRLSRLLMVYLAAPYRKYRKEKS